MADLAGGAVSSGGNQACRGRPSGDCLVAGLDELFSSSPYAYRDRIRRIMATAIHEILLGAGFDARLIADDYVPNTNVEVFDRTAASEHSH